jgi:hypothetical protein
MLNVLGSGTTLVVGVVVAKQVGPVEHNELATWTFPAVIPVEVSALLSTKNSKLVVALPVVARQISCFPTPPHAPKESEPTLTSLTAVIAPTFTLPENPTTGPPSLTVDPPVVVILTQTEVLEMLMLLHIPF